MTPPRSLDRAVPWLAAVALFLCLGLFGGTCGTGNPGTVFDPNRNSNSGGNGDGGTTPPRGDGPSTLPSAGALLRDGAPTLVATAPVDGASGVDPDAALALWFSESLRADTVTALSLVLRPKGDLITQVPLSFTLLAGDRCVVMQPSLPLAPGTTYDLVATDDLTDLDGKRLKPPTNGRLLRFTTDSVGVNLAPKVLGAFPPAGATGVPNDTEVVVVFSKPMDFTGITSAVTLQNETLATAAGYDRSAAAANRHAGNRVFSFPHVDDARDLGSQVQLAIATTLTDAAFLPQALADPYSATFTTLAFARPSTVGFDPAAFAPFAPAINLSNLDVFPLRVSAPPSVLASDLVQLIAHVQGDAEGVQASLPAGAGVVDFSLDLSDGQGGALFASGTQVGFAAFVERDGARSTVQVLRDSEGVETTVANDPVRPVLFSYGPPAGPFGSSFVTDLPELRPYGRASEDIARTAVSFPPGGSAVERSSLVAAGSGVFIGPAFSASLPVEGPLPFEVTLTDMAGNEAALPAPGSVVFRGFLGATDLATAGGSMRVVAFDRDGLQLLSGVQVFIEDFGGGQEASGLTGSDGSISFTGRSGPQSVTLMVPGYQALSVIGVDSSLLSLPLTADHATSGEVQPLVTGVNSGIVTVASNLAALGDGSPDPAQLQEVDLDNLFAPGIQEQLQRPGWFVAFHELQTFPAADRYYRFVGLDPRLLLEPSTGSNLIVPQLPMVESTNQMAGATDHQFPLNVSAGLALGTIQLSRASVQSRIPGLSALATVGAGAVDLSAGGTNGTVELEMSLLDAAVAEGASATEVLLQVYAQDNDGDEALARVAVNDAVTPPPTALQLPDVPVVNGAWSGVSYPFTRPFSDPLAGGPGLYRMTIQDDAAEPGVWQLWIMASASGGGSLTLPSLRETAGGAIGTPPLDMSAGISWTAGLEAFTMPVGFLERGFFFTSLAQDALAWARAVPSAPLGF